MSQTPSAKSLFLEALDLAPAARAAFLERACAGDAALRARVAELLEVFEGAGPFLGAPTVVGAGQSGPAEGPGTIIGRYKLLQLIGEGGFGSVFMAEQTEPVARRVALKIIKLGMDTRQVIARFEAERQALAMMDHPHIARVLDAGATETGRPYFVMELVKGEPVTAYCDKNSLTIRERLDLFAQVCQAVQHAHTKGVIHRDLKPGNILVSTQDGRPHAKIIDFGIAKATERRLTEKTLFTEMRQLIGTPEYMSPEQAEGSLDIDTRTDVYSLGVLLYELLTGATPFDPKRLRSAAYAEVQRIIREEEPEKPSTRLSHAAEALPSVAAQRRVEPARLGPLVRGDLDCVVMKCLEKDRARRYETTSGLAADILRHLAGEPVSAVPPSAAYKVRKFVRRHRVGVLASAAIALALVLGVIGTTGGLVWALRERDRAESEATRARLAEQEQGRERSRADEQRALAVRRAEEIRQVADFQSRMLRGLNPESMGHTIMLTLRDQVGAGLERQWIGEWPDRRLRTPEEVQAGLAAFDQAVSPGHPVDVARRVMDEHVLRRAAETLEEQFPDQPLVLAQLHHAIGRAYLDLGLYDEAEAHLRSALALRAREIGHDHADVAESLNSVGLVLQERGDYTGAESLIRDGLQMRRSVFGPDHADVAMSLSNLASCLINRGDYAAAEPLVRESLDIRRRVLGDENPDVATSLNNLARCRSERGDLAGAEALYRQALPMLRRTLGEENGDVASCLNNFGGVLREMRDYARAEPILREALSLHRKVFGSEHRLVALSLNNLALCLKEAGRHAEAEPLYRESLAMRRSLLGDKHPDVASSLNNLGMLLTDAGRYTEAEPLLREALALWRELYGDRHATVARALHNLGVLLLSKGDYSAAEPLLREGLDLRRELLGNDHEDVGTSLRRLSQTLAAQAEYDEAERLLREALALRRRQFGGAHAVVVAHLNNLAELLRKRGELKGAEPFFREALAMARDLHGNEHPQVVSCLSNLGSLYFERAEYGAAEPLLREALALRRRLLGDDDPAVAGDLHDLAATLHRRGDPVGAEPLFREALSIRRRAYGDEHARVAATWRNLAEALRAKGDPDAAAAELRALLEIQRRAARPNDAEVAAILVQLGLIVLEPKTAPAGAEAEALLREALTLRERLFPDGHALAWLRHSTESLLGAALACQGRVVEAEPLLVGAFERMDPPPREATRKRDALERVVRLYESWDVIEPAKGHDAKAEEWRRRLEEYDRARPAPDQPAQ